MIDTATAEEYLERVDAAPAEEQQRMLHELREYRQRQLEQEREQRATYTRELFKDPETLGGHWLPEMQRALQPFMADPKQDRAAWANTRLFAHEYGISVEQAAGAYDSLLTQYATEHFGGEPKDSLALYGAVSARYQKQDEIAEAQREAIKNALMHGLDDQRRGVPPLWATHEGALRGLDGDKAKALYEENPEAASLLYGQTYMQAFTLMHENPELGGIINALARHMGRDDLAQDGLYAEGEDAIRKSAETLARMEPEKRQAFLSMLPAWLEANGEKDPQGALGRVAEAVRQSADAMGRGADSMFGRGAEIAFGEKEALRRLKEIRDGVPIALNRGKVDIRQMISEKDMGRLFFDAMQDPLATDEQRAELARQLEDQIAMYQVYREVDQIAKEGFKPIRPVLGLGVVEKGAYAAAGSLPYMALTAIPVAGVALAADAMRTQEYNRMRMEYPEMDPEQADTIALWSGAGMAAIEGVQVGRLLRGAGILNRAPRLKKVMEQLRTPTSEFWKPYLKRAAGETGVQGLQEAVQEAIPGMVFNALTEDYPEVDWAADFANTLTDPVMWFAVLPFSMVAHGVGSWRDSRAVARAMKDPQAMTYLGFSEESAAAVAERANAGDMDGANTLFREGWQARKKEDIERGLAEMSRERARAEAIRNDPEGPTIRANGDRWEMVEPDGTVSATFESEEVAMRQYQDRLVWERSGRADSVRDLVAWFQARADPERATEVTGRTKTVEEAAAESPLNAEALAERMRIAAIDEGVDPATLIVKGETTQELQEGVFRDVIRLYNGADVMDVVEEHAHAQENKDTREGLLTREVKAEATRIWAEATGFRLEDAANPTDMEISEALADMVKADFMGRRKELAGLPESVRAFIAKLREYFREVLGRAKALQELRDAGKISESIEGYLARSLGIDEQVELNRATAEAVAEAAAPSYSIGNGGSSRVAVVSAERGAAPNATGAELKKWLRQFRGEHPNRDTGWNVRINEKTEKHLVNQHGAAWKDALAELPTLIEEAVWLGRDEHKEFASGGKIRWQHRLYAAVQIEGEAYLLKLRVNEALPSKALYDIKGAEIKKLATIKGSGTPATSLGYTKAEVAGLVKQAWPRDVVEGQADGGGKPVYSVGVSQTETPAFKRWFGDSKVVNEDGDPLVVYHATESDFPVFDPNRSEEKGVFWFAGDERQATASTGYKKTMPVYLSLQNPVDLSIATERYSPDEWKAILSESGVDVSNLRRNLSRIDDEVSFPELLRNVNSPSPIFTNLQKVLRDQGFDGIIFPPETPRISGGKVYVAFDNKQIKSATGNRGTFDPNDPDIRHSIGRADYLSEMALDLDSRKGADGLAFAEKVRANWERAGRYDDFLARELKLEQEQDARTARLGEEIENLRAEHERQLSELEQAKEAEVARAGEANTVKFGDRIEAAKTDRERKLLEREARETARDLKRGIEKDFKGQVKALKERLRADEVALREKALGTEKAAKVKADEADKRAAMLQALADYNAVLMALPHEVRGKLGGFVKLAKLRTDKARVKFFREQFPKVAAAFEKYLRDGYDEQIRKLLKRTQPKRDKAGQAPKGKLGAEMHALFKGLEDAMYWTPEKAQAHIATLEAEIAAGELSPESEAHKQLEMGLLGMVADWANADSARRAAAVKAVKEVYERGYMEYQLQKTKEREERKARREKLVADTGKSGSATERDERLRRDAGIMGALRTIKFELSSFEQLLGYCFGDQSAEARRLADLQRLADNRRVDEDYLVSDGINALFADLAGSTYGGAEMLWRLQAEKSVKAKGRELTQLEAITATLIWRQEDGRRHMEGRKDEEGNVVSSWSYDQAFIDAIEEQLSSEALAVRDYLAGEYAREWAEINPLFRELNGVDLPRHANYAPLTVKPMQAKTGEMVDPVTGVVVNAASTTPGSFRTRGVAIAEPDFKDAVRVFMAHKSQINHWRAYAKFALEARSILGNREVMNAVEAKAGEGASRALASWVDYLIQGGNRDAAMRMEMTGALARMTSRAAAMAIVGRAGVLAVQSTQLGAALAEMPTASYLKRMGQLFTGQLGWGDALGSAYIQRRMIEMPPLVRQAMEGLKAEKPSRIKHAVMALGRTIAGADALFTAGTYAMVYDYRLAELTRTGMDHAEAQKVAHMEAERITDRLAQPVRPGARSLYEVRTSTSPMTRLAWAFASEARKNLGLVLYAMSNRTLAEKARTLAYVGVVGPLIASLIRSAWRDARDSDDDDVFDSKNWDAKRMALAVLTEPLAGVPVVGEIGQEMIFKGAGVYSPNGGLLSSAANAVPAIKRLPETVSGEQDARQVLRDTESILTGMGLFNANLAAAASLSHIVRDLFGVAENVTDSEK